MFEWVVRNEEQVFPVSILCGVVAVQMKTFPVPYLQFSSCFMGDFTSEISYTFRELIAGALTNAFSCNVVSEVAAH